MDSRRRACGFVYVQQSDANILDFFSALHSASHVYLVEVHIEVVTSLRQTFIWEHL